MTRPFDQAVSLRHCLDALPSIVLLVDDDARILDYNRAAEALVGARPGLELRRLCGDVLACVHAQGGPEACGRTELCRDCVLRAALRETTASGRVIRATAPMRLQDRDKARDAWFLVTATPAEVPGVRATLLILDDATELFQLRRTLPICANCGKVRDDDQLWIEARAYLRKFGGLTLSHGLCPHCAHEIYPE